MVLYIIGLGLNDIKDITLKGLEAIKKSEYIFLEYYTSILNSEIKDFEELYGKKIILADRLLIESNPDKIIDLAKEKNVSFLVVGDPFGATTHSVFYLRAIEKHVEVKIIHNASIINAIGETGLELYKFGAVTSIVFDDEWLPETPYNIIKQNLKRGLHTLCLLDIKIAEPSKENLRKNIYKPEPPRFMSINEAIKILKKIESKKKENIIKNKMLIIGVARLGSENQKIFYGTLEEAERFDFGKPLHSLIIPGKLNEIEKEILKIMKNRLN